MWLSKVPATPHAGGRLSRPAKAPLQARAATQRHADRKGAAAPYADAAINRFQQGTLVSTLFTPTTCAAFQRLAGPERSLLTRRRKAAAAAAPARVVAQRSNTPHGRGLTVKVMASQQDEVIAPGGTMEDVFATLAQRTLARAGELQPGAIYMVGIAGVPGAGKSTTAVAVCREINRLHAAGGGGGDLAVVVPMDGWPRLAAPPPAPMGALCCALPVKGICATVQEAASDIWLPGVRCRVPLLPTAA
mmetsp:Transcript_66565/g.210693  ORF Transcript_66565/g.210693 Transcript_66565/m.210693 type:complete len:247 (-) Transcript_66565:701-1441(-)